MPLELEQRKPFFEERAKELVARYQIRSSRTQDHLSSLRIGHLFQEVLIRMCGSVVGVDALICFRDWALEKKISCSLIPELEEKDGKKTGYNFYNPSNRVHERLDFSRYLNILEEFVCPKRQPLTGRYPVVRLS